MRSISINGRTRIYSIEDEKRKSNCSQLSVCLFVCCLYGGYAIYVYLVYSCFGPFFSFQFFLFSLVFLCLFINEQSFVFQCMWSFIWVLFVSEKNLFCLKFRFSTPCISYAYTLFIYLNIRIDVRIATKDVFHILKTFPQLKQKKNVFTKTSFVVDRWKAGDKKISRPQWIEYEAVEQRKIVRFVT